MDETTMDNELLFWLLMNKIEAHQYNTARGALWFWCCRHEDQSIWRVTIGWGQIRLERVVSVGRSERKRITYDIHYVSSLSNIPLDQFYILDKDYYHILKGHDQQQSEDQAILNLMREYK